MRVVITGSEGFVGRALKEQCRIEGVEAIGIDMVPSDDTGHVIMDIRSPTIEEAIPNGADALVHLAAISRDQDCINAPITAFDVNVGGTLNLLRSARARGVGQFIFASSEWVYGEVGSEDVQTEESPIDLARVKSAYALSKIVGERLLYMTHRDNDSCAVTVLRFGIIYGPRPANWSAVEQLFHAVRTGETVEVRGSLNSGRRFIHVSDIANGMLHSIGRTGYEIFNLCGNSLITLQQVIDQSAELLGRRPRVVERDPLAVSIRNPDNQKARRILGWEPVIGLKEGLSTLFTQG